jgi:choline-sulfatase
MSSRPPKKLNILFVMADQMTPFMLEACTGKGAKTTNLSALAERGVVFQTAYTPSPICVPARAAFMTGLYISRTGSYDNGDPFPSFVPTFAHYLTNQDYEVVLSGKMHFIGADQLHGFKRRLNTDIYPSKFIWSYPLLDDHNPDARAFDFASQYQAQNIGAGWSTELQYDEETHFRALEYLRHAPDKPFMLAVSFTSPHPPYQVPKAYWEMYKDADLPIPHYRENMDESYSELDRAFLRWYGLDRNSIRDPEHLIAMRRGFCALSHYVDDKLGELLAVLEEVGLRDNTIIIFTADHGEMLGEKGLIQKRSLYEWSTRIPMIIDYPGAAHRVVDTPVSLIDLPVTLMEVAGAEPVTPLDGRSLLPAIHGATIENLPVISEYHGEGIMKPCFMVRQGPWKYIYIHNASAQLFNIERDPDEWNNLSGHPDTRKIEKELKDIVTGGSFDLDSIEKDIWERLAQKRVVNQAMAKNGTTWDYRVETDPASLYVRV